MFACLGARVELRVRILALAHRCVRLSIGRGLLAAGTLIELAPGLGFLSICPRHHCCC
jgi:hypothetical protein